MPPIGTILRFGIPVVLVIGSFFVGQGAGKAKGINSMQKKIDQKQEQLTSQIQISHDCFEDMGDIQDAVDAKNAAIDARKAQAAESVRIQAEADRLAAEIARTERRLDQIATEREAFAERLAELPRCEKYLATLVALTGDG